MQWILDTLLIGFPGTSNKTSLGMSTVALATRGDWRVILDTAKFAARGTVLRALEARGLTPADITHVFMTHLHYDHCDNADMYPNAECVFGDVEWRYANEADDIFVQRAVVRGLAGLKHRTVRDGEEVLPGIRAMLTPGHTPGGITYLIDTADGCVAFCGDAIKNRVELSTGEVTMSYDAALSRRTIAKIRNAADFVIPGHDCMLRLEGDHIVPMAENALIISFQQHLYANDRQSAVSITLDDLARG